jgi:four helix bundle protein
MNFEQQFKDRCRAFALDVFGLVEEFPTSMTSQIVAKQLVRCASSIGANYRAACRGKSRSDFVAKLAIAEEEADESLYWLELAASARHVKAERVSRLLDEANQITAILVSSIKTVRGKRL